MLDNAINAWASCGNRSIRLAGHTDRSGPVRYNLRLAGRRDAAVMTYLMARGIAHSLISQQALGESQPRVQTADEVREPQNRRVEIDFGPGFDSLDNAPELPAQATGNSPPSVTP